MTWRQVLVLHALDLKKKLWTDCMWLVAPPGVCGSSWFEIGRAVLSGLG